MKKDNQYSYITDALGTLPFCPGCGHGILIKALDKALLQLQLDPRKIVIVTDIGCLGLSDRFFTTNAFHGLHGRSITYGCGLKLARPELTVIVLQGDGGCGIGGAHLLNVARRNIGITLIIGNNFNYGMTGGQHSITTPEHGLTSTTPWGNVEQPIDLCSTVAAAGGSWVYRGTVFDKDLPEIFEQAIVQKGFSMVDTLELCTAYFSAKNHIKKNELFDIIKNNGFKTGLLVNKPRREYSEHYEKTYNNNKKAIKLQPPIFPKFGHSLTKKTGILIAGSAGQKIKSSATLFAKASMFSGLQATQKDDYPITVMTGPSIAEIILSPNNIEYTAIEYPDYILLLSQEGLLRVMGKVKSLSSTCTIITDTGIHLPETKAKIIQIPLYQTSLKINKQTISILSLSFLLENTKMFESKALKEAISTFQRPNIAKLSLKVLDYGANLVVDHNHKKNS